jgi:hypothetical protein
MKQKAPIHPDEMGLIDLGPDKVSLRELDVLFPTYPVGMPDKNPLFLKHPADIDRLSCFLCILKRRLTGRDRGPS